MPALQQRTGSASRLNFYEEVTQDSDAGIAAGYSLPLSGPSSIQFGQQLMDVPVFKGDALPFGQVLGPITAAGKAPLNLEFLTLGRLLVPFFGRAGYSRPGGGTTSLHRFVIAAAPSVPGWCQLENVSQEATAVVQRARAMRINSMNFNLGTSGPALYDVDVIGIGDIVSSATQLFAPTDDGLIPSTYFNGFVNYKSQTSIADLNALQLNLARNVTRTEVFANSGIAGSTVPGPLLPSGTIRVMFTTTGTNPGADLNLWNDAIQSNEVLIECLISDQPIAGPTFPKKYVRFIMPTCRLSAQSFTPGGMQGLFANASFKAARSVAQNTAAACVAGEMFGTIGGPYNIVAGNVNFGLKVDGGATFTIPLTLGSARTAAHVVADINAFAGVSAVAVADVFLGNYVRVKSKQAGSNFGALSSCQFDTAVANPFHIAGGFDNVVRAGVTNCPILIEVWNSLGATY